MYIFHRFSLNKYLFRFCEKKNLTCRLIYRHMQSYQPVSRWDAKLKVTFSSIIDGCLWSDSYMSGSIGGRSLWSLLTPNKKNEIYVFMCLRHLTGSWDLRSIVSMMVKLISGAADVHGWRWRSLIKYLVCLSDLRE